MVLVNYGNNGLSERAMEGTLAELWYALHLIEASRSRIVYHTLTRAPHDLLVRENGAWYKYEVKRDGSAGNGYDTLAIEYESRVHAGSDEFKADGIQTCDSDMWSHVTDSATYVVHDVPAFCGLVMRGVHAERFRTFIGGKEKRMRLAAVPIDVVKRLDYVDVIRKRYDPRRVIHGAALIDAAMGHDPWPNVTASAGTPAAS